MAKITKVDVKESTYQGKTKKSYLFTLDDGTIGYTSNKEPWTFKEGEAVSYTKEVKTSTKGEYNILTFTRLSNALSPSSAPIPERPQIHVAAGKSIHEVKAEAAASSMKYIVDCFIADKLDWQQIQEKQSYLYGLLASEIDDIFANKK